MIENLALWIGRFWLCVGAVAACALAAWLVVEIALGILRRVAMARGCWKTLLSFLAEYGPKKSDKVRDYIGVRSAFAAREACKRATCWHCAAGTSDAWYADGSGWVHFAQDRVTRIPCKADKMRYLTLKDLGQ